STGTPFGGQQGQAGPASGQPQGFAPFGQPQPQSQPQSPFGQPATSQPGQSQPEFGQFDPQFAQYAQYMQQYAQYLQQSGGQQGQAAAWVPQAGSMFGRPQFRVTHTVAVWMIALLPMLQLVLSLLLLTALGVGDQMLMLAIWLIPYPVT